MFGSSVTLVGEKNAEINIEIQYSGVMRIPSLLLKLLSLLKDCGKKKIQSSFLLNWLIDLSWCSALSLRISGRRVKVGIQIHPWSTGIDIVQYSGQNVDNILQ